VSRSLLTIVVEGDRLAVQSDASNTISAYAWPTVLRKVAAMLEDQATAR
jgi:hypothetical protein